MALQVREQRHVVLSLCTPRLHCHWDELQAGGVGQLILLPVKLAPLCRPSGMTLGLGRHRHHVVGEHVDKGAVQPGDDEVALVNDNVGARSTDVWIVRAAGLPRAHDAEPLEPVRPLAHHSVVNARGEALQVASAQVKSVHHTGTSRGKGRGNMITLREGGRGSRGGEEGVQAKPDSTTRAE